MSILSRVRRHYVVDPPVMEESVGNPTTSEIGYGDSMLYGVKDFARYNPDDLMSRKGFSIYNKMMQDDQVKAVMRFKQYAVISRHYYFDVPQDENGVPDKQQETIGKFFETAINEIRGNFSDKLIEVLSGMINGFSVCEKIYGPIMFDDKPYWGIKDIKLRPHDTLSGGMITDEHGNLQTVRQRIGGRDVEMPLHKIIHYVYQPDKDRIFGESDLRAAYRAWWSKDIAIKFQNIHLERHASGFIWAKITGGLNDPDKKNLEKLLENITAKTSAMTPDTVQLNQLNPLRTDAYEKAVSMYDKAISKSVLVPNLLGISEQGDVGSYSQSDTQLKTFFWILRQIANTLAETLNEQMFRQLAMWNFGTDKFPRFCFAEMSEEQMQAVAKLWREMVSSGAVTAGDTDEKYIRKLMGFPMKSESASKGQIYEYHLKAGVLRKKEIRRSLGLIDPIPGDEDIVQLEDIVPTSTDNNYINSVFPAEPDNTDWIDSLPQDRKENVLKMFAERPWLKRVNFTAIKDGMDNQDETLSQDMADIMGKVRLYLETTISRIIGDRSMGNVKPAEIAGISLPKNLVSDLRKSLRVNLTESLNTAYDEAKAELPKKNNKQGAMDKVQAERFLSSRAMKIAGVIEQNTLTAVQTVLENGIRYDKSLRQVMLDMQTDTNLIALLPKIDAAGRAVNVPARLATIARTNTSYAFNEARQALYQEPEYKGFIEAFEYSAILDDATTEVCQALDGRVQRDWGGHTPPNHFNCRSLLVPITTIDDWNGREDTIPARVKPDKGFM